MKQLARQYAILILFLLIVSVNQICYSQESAISAEDPIENPPKKFFIAEVLIEGNQKTKEQIIYRELRFSQGMVIDSMALIEAISESRTNLLRQPLFNYVTIETILQDAQSVKILIKVEERWYLWPQLAIINNDRNFNTWIQNKDFSKLDYRLTLKKYNLFGLNHIISLGFSEGYTREISFVYNNIYIDKNQKHFIGIRGIYSIQKSVYYKSFQNKQESFISDQNNAFERKYFRFEYDYRPKYNSRHSIYLSFNEININDSLWNLNPFYLGSSQNSNRFFDLRYHYMFDKRDSRSYPLNGYLMDFNASKTGISALDNNSINIFSISGSFREFYNITGKFYAAHSLSVKKSFNNELPYFFKNRLGYKDFIRGFEYYVIECTDYYLVKNSFKFELLPPAISTLKFIPFNKFNKIHYALYLNAFFDIGFAEDKNYDINSQNDLSNRVLYSSGIGFDIATYYDKVISFEYSINNLGQTGFFIHFKSSI